METLKKNRTEIIKEKAGEKIAGNTAEGGITVFLSLILTCICALMGGLFESARTAGCGWYMQMALNSSLDSLMSLYHRDAFETYRLFLLEFEDGEGLAEEMEPYCRAYLESAPFYPLKEQKLTVKDPIRITDGRGIYFEQEIMDFMKFGVWNQETDSEALTELSRGMREAKQFGEIAGLYQENGRKVLALEKSIDRIGDCLKRQKQYLQEAEKALNQCSGSGFFSAASRLEKELDRIPKLVEAYEKEAERLEEELDISETQVRERKADLGEETNSLTESEMAAYRSYTDTEGERRQEVREVKALSEKNKRILEQAVLKAGEVQDYINSWEPEDEDDELDEEALWKEVSYILTRFQTDGRFEASRVKDKKTMNVLEAVSRLAGGDLLTLCVPEGTKISRAVLDSSDLPSRLDHTGSNSYHMSGNLIKDLADTGLFNEYITRYFSSFRSKERGMLQYEQEYLIHGALSERENLKAAVNWLIAAREAANLLCLFRDSEKRAEAEALALAITGAAGIAPLVTVVTFFILTVWAFAESVEEVRSLLAGGRVPFFKTRETWKLSLSGLTEAGKRVWNNPPDTENGDGLDYNDWLKLFFLIQDRVQLRYRMMDVIQNEIRQKQPGFQMEQCAFRVEAEWYGMGSRVPIKRKAGREY